MFSFRTFIHKFIKMDIKVAILEDNNEIRENLSVLINAYQGFKCIATYENVESALQGIPSDKPDVALIDIHLPDGTGHDCIARLKPVCKSTQFMVFSIFEDADNIFKALSMGATGYLTKNTPPAKIMEAITEIYQGGSPMSSQIARKVISSFQKVRLPQQEYELTQRENEILDLLSKGHRYKEIGTKLFISTETVRTHIRNIYEKLQVSSRVEALNKVFGHF